jgi:hypothetical protein
VKSWIRIRIGIEVMRIRNPGFGFEFLETLKISMNTETFYLLLFYASLTFLANFYFLLQAYGWSLPAKSPSSPSTSRCGVLST